MVKRSMDFTIDNSELIELRKEFNKYGQKDVLKVLSKFHREIAKEQLVDIRAKAKKQRVPKARASAMGFTASGTRTEAKITLKSNDKRPSTWSMEYGRRYMYVPTKKGNTRAVSRSEVGNLRYSRPGAQFPYKKWIGNQHQKGESTFTEMGKKGYVVGKTLSDNQNQIAETYNDRLYNALIKAIN
jgi:hypothetical protein